MRAAGEDAAARAPASAAHWFAGALRLLPATAPADDRVALLFGRAQALAATGQFTDSHEALLESLALVPAQATATRARLTAACAAVEHLLGDHEQAHARLAGALNDLADAASPEAVALMIELAGDAIFRLQYETAQDWGHRAVAAARPIGDRPLTAAALAVLARSLAWGGAAEPGEVARTEAAALIDSLSDDGARPTAGRRSQSCRLGDLPRPLHRGRRARRTGRRSRPRDGAGTALPRRVRHPRRCVVRGRSPGRSR